MPSQSSESDASPSSSNSSEDTSPPTTEPSPDSSPSSLADSPDTSPPSDNAASPPDTCTSDDQQLLTSFFHFLGPDATDSATPPQPNEVYRTHHNTFAPFTQAV